MNRRHLISVMAGIAVLPGIPARAATGPEIIVHKDPSCGCCGAWIEHLRQNGFWVEGRDVTDLWAIKERFGVPTDLASCHTAAVGGYVVEGHVPADAVAQLLAERPPATGLAVPGMPLGSPGMEVAGMVPDSYAVILFGPTGTTTFASYKGGQRLSP